MPESVFNRFDRAASSPLRVVGGSPVQATFDGFGPPSLASAVATLRSGALIPPRPWLYGTFGVRGFVSALIGPGGVGKTAYAVAMLLSVAGGRALLGEWVHAQANVLACNLEDSDEEFDRRIAAAMTLHGLDDERLAGRIFTLNGRHRRLLMAARGDDGLSVTFPDRDGMIALVRERQIGLIIVDPFVNSHDLDENDNRQVNAAVRAWAEVAELGHCAVVPVHHTRKGAVAGDADSARGASAMINACRAVVSISSMTPPEAEKYGIPEAERRLHVRLDDAKANLAPPADRVRWLRLHSVALGNGTPDYPHGDHVQAVARWEPPSVWADHSPADLNRVLDVIAAGPRIGDRYTVSRRGGASRWAGRPLVDHLGVADEQAAQMLRGWLKSGLLVESSYFDAVQRKTRLGVEVTDSLRPTEGAA